MKVNFKKIRVETSIGIFEVVDLAHSLANTLFSSCSTLDEDTVVRKIYNSTCEVDLSEQECNLIKTLMQRSQIMYTVKKAIEDVFNTPTNKSINKKKK